MTKTTHTPGPWEANATAIETTASPAVVIAHVVSDEVWAGASDPREREANQHLIASAPDLLEACEAVKRHGLKGKMPDGRWAFDLLGPAIAKAKGHE